MKSEEIKKVTGILKEVYPAYGRDMQEGKNEVSELAGKLVSDLPDFLRRGEKIFSKDSQKEFDSLDKISREFRQEFIEQFPAVPLLSEQERWACNKIQTALLEITKEWNDSINAFKNAFKDEKITLEGESEIIRKFNFQTTFGSFVRNADHVNRRVELLEKFENIRLRTIKELEGFLASIEVK